jgi:hypothetical protein
MVRPERTASDGGLSCIELTGVSPVAVSAEAPRSRPRAREEIPSSEWGVKSPRRFVRVDGGEQVRRPSIKRTLQPRDIGIRKETGWPSRSCHGEGNRLHQAMVGAVQDARGVWRRACGHSSMRNRRDPFPAAKSGEGGPYKPMAKADRAGRESEGFIVPKGRLRLPVKPAKAGRGKEPCFGYGRVWR